MAGSKKMKPTFRVRIFAGGALVAVYLGPSAPERAASSERAGASGGKHEVGEEATWHLLPPLRLHDHHRHPIRSPPVDHVNRIDTGSHGLAPDGHSPSAKTDPPFPGQALRTAIAQVLEDTPSAAGGATRRREIAALLLRRRGSAFVASQRGLTVHVTRDGCFLKTPATDSAAAPSSSFSSTARGADATSVRLRPAPL